MALHLIEWLARADSYGTAARTADVVAVSEVVGRSFADWNAAESALEAYVQSAKPDDDERLLRLFAGIERRRMAVFGPTRIGHSATKVHLPPLR
jgi:hypothetical protein